MQKFPCFQILAPLLLLQSCASPRLMEQSAIKELTGQKDLQSAHIGITVFDPQTGQFLYNYQGDKYFVPASNTKLFSLYAGMKWLGDSLVGIRYLERDTDLLLLPSGDPSFLHPDFIRQPVMDFLKKKTRNIFIATSNWQEQALGAGWSWDDYNDDYMPERSSLPLFGNVVRWVQERQKQSNQAFAETPSVYSIPEVDWKVRFTTDTGARHFFVRRKKDENVFEITQGPEAYRSQDVPFVTNGLTAAVNLLKDTVGTSILTIPGIPIHTSALQVIHSQPTDSLFRPMMYRSDNFFAEQTLLMVSNEKLGFMNDKKIIDTLLVTDLGGLPQKPQWADGSGLSRYNLFTPQDFVWLLNRMKNEFGFERMKSILPTGGSGTLGNYYKQDSGFIYAKTGSLSGVICLSGYLISKANRLLLFSVLVNNHQGSASAIRRSVEKFLDSVRRNH